MSRAQPNNGRLRLQAPVVGLLAVCLLLAGGMLLTAYLSYRAAERAASDVLLARAAEVGSAFAAAVRFADDQDPATLQRLAKETAGDGLWIAVIDSEGHTIAHAGPEPAPQATALAGESLQQLRVTGRAYRQDPAQRILVYWRPLGIPPDQRRWRRELRRHWAKRLHRRWDRHWRGPGPGPDRPPFAPRRTRPGWLRKQRRFARVVVPYATADALLAPARTTLLTAGGGSALLLLLGGLLFFAARRAQQAQRELQRREALSALGEMGAVLAHEIRTPLAAIKGNAQLIEESQHGDERAGAIVAESSRLERLVNGMLDFARPGESQRVDCQPDELLTRAVQIVTPKAEAAGVAVMTDPLGSTAGFTADPDQLLQVLVNLLQNAIEATAEADDPDPDPVAIRARRRLGRVVFTVLDRGPGFGDAPVDKLLQPFYSSRKKAMTAGQHNAGLGLSVARQIVRQHGGELRLDNRPGGGAEISVSLPVRG